MAANDKNSERDALAAEYVLGTLDKTEREDVERSLKTDETLRRAVADWQEKLSPLLESIDPVPPPPDALEGVLSRIELESGGPATANVVHLKRRLAVWRGATAAAAALAAGLALYIALPGAPAPQGGQFVAVLESKDQDPAFVASIDLTEGTIAIVRLASQPARGRSYELWALGAGRKAPESLGVINASYKIPVQQLGATDRASLRETVFAVSLEPEGGSPTGQPTGPVVFTGKIVPLSQGDK